MTALDEIREQEDAEITLTRITRTARSGPTGDPPLGRLSACQYEVFDLARRRGYYVWPRETTPQELADDLGITTSTLHEHLHKAEQKLLDLS
ncbi:helix-turn-helix domain-containing protein [Halalkalicoccus salilacus]|uniref:helix-turn-helix domain-containing protein n=1 Tax=Halalkalicoccus TaxID=332246 RepID=UPI002F963692